MNLVNFMNISLIPMRWQFRRLRELITEAETPTVNLVNLVNFAKVLDGPECPVWSTNGRTARRIPRPGAIAK